MLRLQLVWFQRRGSWHESRSKAFSQHTSHVLTGSVILIRESHSWNVSSKTLAHFSRVFAVALFDLSEKMMNRSFRLCAIVVVTGLLTRFALQQTVSAGGKERLSEDHPEILAGKWVLDLKRSSLGSDPYEQFDAWTLTFTQVTATTLAWTSDATIHDKTITFSWTGPIDGSPKPLIGAEGSDAYRWHKSALIRLSDLGHGETKRDTVTISQDGETMTIRDRSTTPHGVVFATLVMHRQH